jgi:hypothetical protein
MPCFTAGRDAITALQSQIERAPDTTIEADIESGAVAAGDLKLAASVPAALRDAFVSGQWNPSAMLLDRFDEVRAVAKRLPYLNGFA